MRTATPKNLPQAGSNYCPGQYYAQSTLFVIHLGTMPLTLHRIGNSRLAWAAASYIVEVAAAAAAAADDDDNDADTFHAEDAARASAAVAAKLDCKKCR